MIEAPQSEWLLWAKRWKDEQKAVQRRVEALERECGELRKASVDGLPGGAAASPADQHGDAHHQLASTSKPVEALIETGSKAPGTSTLATTWQKQGTATLMQYFESVKEQHALQEEQLVRDFIAGLRPGVERESLEASFRAGGHTWQQLCVHVQALLERPHPRRPVRRSLI